MIDGSPLAQEPRAAPATNASAKSVMVATRPADGLLTTSYSVYCIRPHSIAQPVGKRARNRGARDIEFRMSSSTEAEGCGARAAAAAGTEPTVAAGSLISERSTTLLRTCTLALRLYSTQSNGGEAWPAWGLAAKKAPRLSIKSSPSFDDGDGLSWEPHLQGPTAMPRGSIQ